MNLLARREQSLHELKHKLLRRFDDQDLMDQVLQRLVDENLQSDERFAHSFARHRSNRGYGPVRVRQEMRERGLSDHQIDVAIEYAEIDWHALAEEVFSKKFGESAATELKEKARRVRFMQYRGFSGSHYKSMLK
ncbi:MAG: regulatory protein RecX [Halieaceae bacterium]|nr:regulatory protein RecX [Halieaceae bacterium]